MKLAEALILRADCQKRIAQLKSGLLVNAKVQEAGLMDSSYKIPGGGLVTTAEDFVRFGVSLMDGKILKPDTLAAMWIPTKRPGPDGKPSNYGIGFGVQSTNGLMFVAHDGSQQGTSTDIEFFPAKRLAVVVLMNIDHARPVDVV